MKTCRQHKGHQCLPTDCDHLPFCLQIDQLRAEVEKLEKQSTKAEMNFQVKDKILDWFANGRTGVSSESMACAAAGIKIKTRFFSSTPSDPDDMNRCLLLLNQVPEIRNFFDEISEIDEDWARLIKRWDEVEKCFLDEVGLDWCNGGSAPKTYALMKSVGC